MMRVMAPTVETFKKLLILGFDHRTPSAITPMEAKTAIRVR